MESRAVVRPEGPAELTMTMRCVPTQDTSLAREKTFAAVSPFPLANPVLSPLNAGCLPFHPPSAVDYQCFRDTTGTPQCRLTTGASTLIAPGNGFSSTPRPTNTSTGSISSGATSRISFNLFSVAPLLGWTGESSQVNRLHYISI